MFFELMYKIKQLPEDFIVREINNLKFDNNGKYCYFALKKKNYTTLRAVQAIAKKLRINEKSIGFAGNKDKNAVTEQAISIYNGNKSIENIKIKDIGLEYLGRGNEEIYLGNLKGNEFIIAIRNLAKEGIEKIKGKTSNNEIYIPNYFGQQRFSSNNSLIGKSIIKNNFKKAINLALKSNSDYSEKINQHLQKHKNDFIGALKIIPFKLLKLYIHSYQSFLFNKTLEHCIKSNRKLINETIPIAGFGTEISNKNIENIIKKVLDKEKISLRDFIVRQIPDLSQEGSERSPLIKVDDFKIISIENDELNKNKEKITISFSLPKGSYATVLVDYLFS